MSSPGRDVGTACQEKGGKNNYKSPRPKGRNSSSVISSLSSEWSCPWAARVSLAERGSASSASNPPGKGFPTLIPDGSSGRALLQTLLPPPPDCIKLCY